MNTDIALAIIPAVAAVILAAISYWFTKKGERVSELRKEKLENYKDFVACINGVLEEVTTLENRASFSKACNKLNLIAPQSVIEAMNDFRQEIAISNTTRCKNRHDKLLSTLFYEIRRDLGVSPKDDDSTFMVKLWAA